MVERCMGAVLSSVAELKMMYSYKSRLVFGANIKHCDCTDMVNP